MRTTAIFVLLFMFVGIIFTAPLQIRTDHISTKDGVEVRTEPLFDPDFQEHFTLFDDYGVKPFPPRVPHFLMHEDGTYEPDLDEEYY